MAVLTGRSLGKKNTHDDGFGNNAAKKKAGYERGFPQRWLITAEVRGSMGTEGGRDGQS